MMKVRHRFGFIIIAFVLLIPISSRSADFGVGARLGDPTGLSVKMWNQPGQSMNFAAAWALGGNPSLVLQADYVFYNYDLLNIDFEEGTLPLYYGFGAKVRLADAGEVGVRLPVGVTFKFTDHPVDFFFELSPTLNVFPETVFDLYGGIGAHYYF